MIHKKNNRSLITSAGKTAVVFLLINLFLASTCKSQPNEKWVGTWNCAPQLVEPHNMPPLPGLTNNTIRQIVRVSLGGDSLRLRFSNEFSTSPVTIKKVNIAVSNSDSTIDPVTIKELRFNNKPDITMQPGVTIKSDVVAFNLKPRMDLAITIYFGETSKDVTGHPGSRTTSYLLTGDKSSSIDFAGSIHTDHWYIINGIDVKAPSSAFAVAIIGNSITDGRGSGTNKQNRWPDILAERLLKDPATSKVAVLNQGIGGNCVLKECLGQSALKRFERDVLKQNGVRWLIIFEGVNDIGQSSTEEDAIRVTNEMTAAYKTMINAAHEKNIIVYGATIAPFGKSFYYKDFREKARSEINEWIRNSGNFDAVIDFDKLLQNPEDPLTIIDNLHTGDFLHPNETGYKMMGEYIDLKLFYKK